MIRKKDYILINSKKCQEKGCKKVACAMAKNKFLCESCFREIIPEKRGHYRDKIWLRKFNKKG